MPNGCPLLSQWSGVQSLAVYPHPTKGTGQYVGLTHVSWDAAQWNSITRRLANQSHGIHLSLSHSPTQSSSTPSSSSGYFMSLREAVRSGVELQGSELLLYSRHFRSALHECVLALREEERRTLSGETWEGGVWSNGVFFLCVFLSLETYRKQAELFSMVALIWHLAEILFIEVTGGCEWHVILCISTDRCYLLAVWCSSLWSGCAGRGRRERGRDCKLSWLTTLQRTTLTTGTWSIACC